MNSATFHRRLSHPLERLPRKYFKKVKKLFANSRNNASPRRVHEGVLTEACPDALDEIFWWFFECTSSVDVVPCLILSLVNTGIRKLESPLMRAIHGTGCRFIVVADKFELDKLHDV